MGLDIYIYVCVCVCCVYTCRKRRDEGSESERGPLTHVRTGKVEVGSRHRYRSLSLSLSHAHIYVCVYEVWEPRTHAQVTERKKERERKGGKRYLPALHYQCSPT